MEKYINKLVTHVHTWPTNNGPATEDRTVLLMAVVGEWAMVKRMPSRMPYVCAVKNLNPKIPEFSCKIPYKKTYTLKSEKFDAVVNVKYKAIESFSNDDPKP